QIAVAAEGNGEPPVPLVGERRANRGRRVVAHSGTAGAAVPLVGLLDVPQPQRPDVADGVADERPVLVLDLGIDFRAHTRGGDRARVPAQRRVRLRLLDHGEPRSRELLAACVVRGFPALVDEPLHRFGQCRQRSLAVAGNGEVDFLEARKILIIGLLVEVAAAERDNLGALLVHLPVAANDAVAELVEDAPQIVHLERQDDVGLGEHGVAGGGAPGGGRGPGGRPWLGGGAGGRSMGPALSIPAHCSARATSTSRAKPAGVRARRSQTITGFSAPASSFAASAIAPESPCGGITLASLGMRSVSASWIGFSCSSASSESSTGPIGGVIAIL